ncbi:MAG: TfoX/Sxy family protein [Rhodocyclales bacterium]|nr:TfoX/Sxy family protein [Rhodocyclales bacterium]
MPRPVPELVIHASELFAPLGHIRSKAMFGGWGFYCDELFFAIVVDETLYLKADADSAGRFRAAGGEPFRYAKKDGRMETMNYWTVPEEAMETPAGMRPWAQEALAAAVRARKPAKPPKSPKILQPRQKAKP